MIELQLLPAIDAIGRRCQRALKPSGRGGRVPFLAGSAALAFAWVALRRGAA